MSTFTKRIAANGSDSIDDGLAYYDGAWNYNPWAFFLGYYTGNTMKAWLRFTSITIAQGATITSAKITLVASVSESTASRSMRIYGNNVDSATAPTNYTGLTGLSKTTAYTTWTLPAVTSGSSYDSADIKDVVQEIVNRSGWASGNAMQFIIDTCSGSTDMTKQFYDYNDDTTKAALLTIEYTTGTQYTKTLTVSINLVGNFVKSAGKRVSGTINTTPNMRKSSNKSLSGSATISGTVSRGMALLKTLQGAINASGLFSRSTNKVITATVNASSGTIRRGITKRITGTVNSSGAIFRRTTKTIIGSAIATGNTTRAYGKTLVASISASASIFRRAVNKALSTAITATGYNVKVSNKKLSGTATVTATNRKSTHKLLSYTTTLSSEMSIGGAAVTLYNAGTAPIGLGAQEGAIFNIIVTGTFTSFTIELNGKTLTYTDNIVNGSVTIYNTSANCTDRSKLTGNTSEYLTLLAGNNIALVSKVGGNVDFKFEYTPLYL